MLSLNQNTSNTGGQDAYSGLDDTFRAQAPTCLPIPPTCVGRHPVLLSLSSQGPQGVSLLHSGQEALFDVSNRLLLTVTVTLRHVPNDSGGVKASAGHVVTLSTWREEGWHQTDVSEACHSVIPTERTMGGQETRRERVTKGVGKNDMECKLEGG